eukprot:TRINITY_DN5237_c0_g1_i4.p1 TRINITY_DN5237_c0_g1~~TRINITY_DN5237_c0_g1_i4.p1  ORF type:complete len:147 (-),score=58.59 TRINITY_DN5237_c0_g1_i4:160-555(-)
MSQVTIIYAASKGYTDVLEELLKKEGKKVNDVDQGGNTALHLAAGSGRLDCVNMLLKSTSINVNIQNKQGNTALHQASWRNHPDVIKALIDKQAKTELKNKDGKLPVDLARSSEAKDLFKTGEDWDIDEDD